MNRSVALVIVAIVGSVLWIASGRAEPAAVPPAATAAAGPWQVIALPAAQNDPYAHAILLNNATGESWSYTTQNSNWQQITR